LVQEKLYFRCDDTWSGYKEMYMIDKMNRSRENIERTSEEHEIKNGKL